MTYPDISTINNSDPTNVFVYANTITDGVFMPLVLLTFFIILCVGGYFMQLRIFGRGNFAANFTVSAFSSFGFAVIMSTKDGLLDPAYAFISLGVAILGVAWIYLSSE